MLHLEANPYLQREKYLYHSSEYHAGEGFRPHDHEFCEFFVVLEGELEQTLNGRSAVLPAGTVQLLLPGDAHGIGCAPGCEFVRIFNCNVLREEFQKEFLHFAAELEIAPDDLLARGMIPPGARRKLIFEDCEALLARRGKFGRFRNALLRTLLSQLLWVLLRQSGVEENGAPKWLLDACAAMHREENFRAGLKRLVELSGRTQEHLNRTMWKHFGMTPRGYLTNLRLEAVFQELIQGRGDITSAAFRAGFVNLAGFRRAFRKKYLVSPRQIKELGHHSGSGGA